MNRDIQSLKRAVGRLLVRLWQQSVPPSVAHPPNANLPASLPGRWPDAEGLLAPRTPIVTSSQPETATKPTSS
jgi:hypothetical protein